MKKGIFLLLIYFLSIHLYSQQITTPDSGNLLPGSELFATPDVMAFQKYNALPVNLYTGKVNINLPIYTIDSGDMSIPISVSYNTGGIKVDDIASSVGLGWNLNAGGNIVSVVKDIHDQTFRKGLISEIDPDYGSISYRYVTQKGYLREYDEILEENSSYDLYQGYDKEAEEDASPDIFIANAPGLSSKFILEKNTTTYDILPIDGSGITNSSPITYGKLNGNNLGFQLNELSITDYGGNAPTTNWTDIFDFYGYNTFELVNTNGVKYLFDKKDLRESLSRQAVYSPINIGRVNTGVTAHHLSSMFDPKSNTTINFKYEEYQKGTVQHERAIIEDALTNHASPENWASLRVFGHLPLIKSLNDNNNQIDENILKSSLNFVKYKKAHRLNEISFENGKVEFIYDHIRQDTYDEKALTEIVVKDVNNSVVKRFVFDYSYFLSKENCSQPECKRLKLQRIRQIGDNNTSIDLYAFDYYYSNPLPKVKALQQDFLGYYNNNGVTTPAISNFQRKQPTLYYHKNKGTNSILPFPLQGQTALSIPGDFSLQPNNYSLSGTLKSVQYKTGGKSEFEYETHDFNFLNNQYTAGGARIKRQRLTDENQNVKVLEYEYKHSNGKSSGYINSLPVFGYPYVWDPSKTTNNVSFAVFDKPRNALELTDGSFIGYSEVIEKEIGNGFTIHKFVSPETVSNIPETYVTINQGDPRYNASNYQPALDFLKNNSAYPSSHYIDNDILRGQPLSTEIRNESNSTVKRIEYEYDRKIFNTINLNYRDVLDNYGRNNQSLDFGTWHFYHSSKLNIERNLKSKTTTTEYLESGNKTTTEYYQYDNAYPFLKQHRIVDNVNELKTNIFYPFDPEINGQPNMATLISQNRLIEPIKQEIRQDNTLTNTNLISYHNFNNTVILPNKVSEGKGNLSLQETSIIDKRDNKGNLLQYHKEDDISTTIIWGYNNNYPIAKIENATYDQVNPYVTDLKNKANADNDHTKGYLGKEGELRQALDNLRTTLPDAMVTTYTYDPLIGMTSTTDPKGYTTYYQYDGFNRLQFILDADDKVIKKINYNYEGQHSYGGITFNITSQGPVAPEKPITFATSALGNPGEFLYTWLVDGIKEQCDSTTSFTKTFDSEGDHIITLLVYDIKTKRLLKSKPTPVLVRYPELNIPNATHNGTDPIFIGDPVTFTGSYAGGGSGSYSYSWWEGSAKVTSSSSFTKSFTTPGTKTLRFRLADLKTGKVKEKTISIVVYANITVPTISSRTHIVKGTTVQFTANNVSGGSGKYKYEWYVNNVKQSGTFKEFSYRHTSAGSYTVKVKAIDLKYSNKYNWSGVRTVYSYNPMSVTATPGHAHLNNANPSVTFRINTPTGGSGHYTRGKWKIWKITHPSSRETRNSTASTFTYSTTTNGEYELSVDFTDTKTGQKYSVTMPVIVNRSSGGGGGNTGEQH
ncbi:PKD domain-containing protein [Aquimarina algiphila]|uniref:PKD domain-containing protein n=1 Tax=Aquimarina algiphila TaxID=2047982 RepID=UPI00232FD646|nr:PKD domain-containing protein [Aquimarina algiphila]